MNRESASVIIHFREGGAEELLKDLLGEAMPCAREAERMVEMELSRTELKTVVEALDYMAMAMEAAEFPCGYVDDLIEKFQTLLEE